HRSRQRRPAGPDGDRGGREPGQSGRRNQRRRSRVSFPWERTTAEGELMADQQQSVRVFGERSAPEPARTGDNHDVRVLSGNGAVVPKPPTVTLMVQTEVAVATDRQAGPALP